VNPRRHLRDLPPTTAVVLIVVIVLGFAALLLALGQRAGGISVGILGGTFGGVVSILRAVRNMLPPGRGDDTGPDQPPPAPGPDAPIDPDHSCPGGTTLDGPADDRADPAALTP
jgi:hypothetical protein